jgi:hypothetical protein
MKIHFLSIVGVDFDLDLFYPFVRYYQARKFDSYTIFLHSEKGPIDPSIILDFENEGFDVRIAHGLFKEGLVRKVYFDNFARNLPENDFLVTADFDEFHCTKNHDPLDYRKLLEEYDVLYGYLADRHSNNFDEAHAADFRSLLFQYPFEDEDWNTSPFRAFTPPWLHTKSWPIGFRHKIIAARAGVDMNFIGSHNINFVSHTDKLNGDLKIAHFAWREGAAKKLAVKSYFSIENLKEAFKGEVPADVEHDHFTHVKTFLNMQTENTLCV